jgi:predicted transcriptional regulator
MLTSDTIEKIKTLHTKGFTVDGITKALNVSRWAVQKYGKEPKTAVLMEHIEALKIVTDEMKLIIENLKSRIKVLEEIKPATERTNEEQNNIIQHTENLPTVDPFIAIIAKGYTTANELGKIEGYKAYSTILRELNKREDYKVQFYGTKVKHYRILVKDVDDFKK